MAARRRGLPSEQLAERTVELGRGQNGRSATGSLLELQGYTAKRDDRAGQDEVSGVAIGPKDTERRVLAA